MVTLTIDKKQVTVPENATILEAARSANINIPTLCYLKDINEIGACRLCVVEVDGMERLVPACDNVVADGMVVHTNSPKVREARRTNLRLILSHHDVSCTNCTRSGNCVLQTLANDFNMRGTHYPKKLRHEPINYTAPLIRENDKCVMCMRCIQICEKVQSVKIWDLLGTGSRSVVEVSHNRHIQDTECTYCGQCITHCPTAALRERDDTGKVYDAIDDADKITVVQVAPAVRAAWAEQFGLSSEEATPERMVSALREVGFDYVFDTDFAADLTIMEEGSEFIERFTNKAEHSWPMFTSCCPGWVRFLKSQYPELTENLSTAKSPQQMFGAITKSYFAEKIGVDPKKLFVVSVMPCVSKKSECALPTMKDACGEPDVDVSITTRELNIMMRANHIDPRFLEEQKFDSPLGASTGAAVIFGATGGVMDAALRSAYYLITGSNPDPDTFTAVRGMDGWKEAVFSIPGAGDVRVAVVSGLGNARKLLEALKRREVAYDFVEVMACPGGCAGGGGQPIHEGCELAEQRGGVLWRLDKGETIRFSHENPEVAALYRDFLGKPLGEKSHHLLHTDHTAWEMPTAVE
ncbi:MAG: NADH-dependent [FeFe] hydrogenase, group A6 [Eubacteriales bacterium]|nr:NADH-dependent [FeFe] hydrogenase, group A6 [Eubacteriales bacterium]